MSSRFRYKSESICYRCSVNSLHIRAKHKSRFTTKTYKSFLDTNLVMIKANGFLKDKHCSMQMKIVTIKLVVEVNTVSVLVISEDLVCLISSISE